jgi:2-haloacid dehalogenase
MMDKVRKGTLRWMKPDALHRMILDELLVEFKIGGLSEEEKEDWNHAVAVQDERNHREAPTRHGG